MSCDGGKQQGLSTCGLHLHYVQHCMADVHCLLDVPNSIEIDALTPILQKRKNRAQLREVKQLAQAYQSRERESLDQN